MWLVFSVPVSPFTVTAAPGGTVKVRVTPLKEVTCSAVPESVADTAETSPVYGLVPPDSFRVSMRIPSMVHTASV